MGRIIDKAKECGQVRGLEVGENRVNITHLQFPDDSLLFANANDDSLVRLMNQVKIFCRISGLKLNEEKCALLGINVSEEAIRQITNGGRVTRRGHTLLIQELCGREDYRVKTNVPP
ncbi:hypothetical protein Syun_010366 [Stephania yunnanensis]|uniref:Reverse transcriptase domain-containing protein n=1 Tax=Stephania yunnanensis TaxID=152371 RepID=A0AAP0KIN9_9MAGN